MKRFYRLMTVNETGEPTHGQQRAAAEGVGQSLLSGGWLCGPRPLTHPLCASVFLPIKWGW